MARLRAPGVPLHRTETWAPVLLQDMRTRTGVQPELPPTDVEQDSVFHPTDKRRQTPGTFSVTYDYWERAQTLSLRSPAPMCPSMIVFVSMEMSRPDVFEDVKH